MGMLCIQTEVARGTLVAQLVERWTCNWKVAVSNSGLEVPCGTISIFFAPYAVPVFQKRHKTETLSQSLNGTDSLNYTLYFFGGLHIPLITIKTYR